jgi:4-hydroxy-tetrahydrodipicolinate synthase
VPEGSPAAPRVAGAVDPQRTSTYVISITPFGPDGAFDEEAVRSHLRRLAAGGIGVYLGGGGSGEGYVLFLDEVRRLLEIGVEELKGKVPLRAMGVEPRTSRQMIDFVDMIKDVGVDATQIYSLDQGHGHRPMPQEISRYFLDIFSSIDMPSVLSTHQSVGYQVPVPLLVELAERFDHLIGINCSHQDLRYLSEIVDAVGDRLEVHVGGPHLGLTSLALGGNGFLSSEGNLVPKLCVGVIEAYRANDAQRAASLFGKVLRLSSALYGAGGIRATKAVLNSLGFAVGPPRVPQLPISDETVASLRRLIDELGIAEIEGW